MLVRLSALTALAVLAIACGDGGKDAPEQIADAATDLNKNNGLDGDAEADQGGGPDTAPADSQPGDTQPGDTQPGDTGIGDVTPGDSGATDVQGADGDATTIDTTDTDGGPTCPGSAGCACKDVKDCGTNGVCGFDGAGKQVCLAACGSDGSCPAGQTCLKDAAGSACADQAAVNCAPCKEDKVCGSKGACVSYGAAGNFCGSPCSADADCAEGYACSDSTNIAGTKAKYCKTKDAAGCSCGPLAKQAKASTTCSNGACTGERSCGAEGLSLCSAASPTDESCDGKDNNCNGQTDESAPCTDKNACTTDTCVAGKCEGAAITCDDKNPCTTDSCDPATGCTAKADDALACSDGDACTADSCKAGKCTGTALVCDDKNPCTKDSCAPLSGCATATDDAGTCSDGNPCTKDSCNAGTCQSGDAKCDDGNACTNDACDAAKGCVNLAKAASACDDGDACTKDSCDPKAGCGHAKIAGCLPSVVYATEFPCGNPQGWSMDPPPVGSSASWAIDGTPKPKTPECSLNFNNGKDFACINGALSAPASWATSPEIDASAYPAWTAFYATFELGGTWSNGQTALMQYSTDGTTWSSLGVLTKSGYDKPTKQSVKISGAGGKKFKVRFGFNTASCLLTSGTGPYIDGLKIADSACQQDSDCDDKDACSQDSCDTKNGACLHAIATGKCDDNNPCTSGDTCVDGACEGKPTTGGTCDDANVCTSGDACADGSCTGDPTSKACDDGVACTVNDACNSSGYCNGATKSCDDGNPCTTDGCDPASGVCKSQVVADGASCSDGDSCTVSDVCIGGQCSSRAKCDDGNPCTDDSCSTSGSCTNAAVTAGTPCTDGDACTSGDACAGSTCKGTPAGCKILWQDDFASCDGNGWSLDLPSVATWTAWGVDGTALPPGSFSPACSLNFNNGKDFQCATGQVKVAGVATSPVIDLTNATQATLKYMAWFQTSTDNATDHRSVQVSADGFKTVLFSVLLSNSGSMSSWQPASLDLTPVKGKKVQVRFGFDSLHCTTNTGVGWFIDDLKVVVDAVKVCSAPNDCNDNNACTDDACTSNKCVYTAKTSGSCDDGNPCTTSDACSAGSCKGSNLSCNDSNACTVDTCDPKTGCVSVPGLDGVSCGDGDSCTLGDACVAGKCVGPLAKCDDGNPCTKDSCASGGTCTNAALADGEACSDGDPCTTADACAAGKCVAKAGPCQVIASDSIDCDSQGWVLSKPASADGPAWGIDGAPAPGYSSAACSLNFNAATSGFACPAGATSVSGTATSAAKFDLSAAKTASLKFNSYASVGSATSADLRRIEVSADDFATVPVKHLISNYSGLSSWQAVVLDLTPLAGKIVKVRFTFDSVTCDSNSGNGWFIDDVQVVGDNGASCAKDADCDDKDPCSADTCLGGKCSHAAASGAECNDNNLCTTKELCSSGQCKGGTAVTCNDGNACTADTCVPAKGCVYTALVDGASCSDGNSCVASDVCKAGNCVGTFTLPDGSSCSDGESCTVGDTCAGGKCVAKAAAPDGTACSGGADPCVIGKLCQAGACGGPSACDDADACTLDICEKVGTTGKNCTHTAAPDGGLCDDGVPCTTGDVCKTGQCKGAMACTVASALPDDCKPGNWLLDAPVGATGWGMDATPTPPGFKSAPCSLNFNNGTDYSEPGLATKGAATSPSFTVPAGASLMFQSYSDTESSTAYDKKFVEISADEFKTVDLSWQVTPASGEQKKWLSYAFGLTKVEGKAVKYRFRFDSGDSAVNSTAGWFVDDVLVAAVGTLPPQPAFCQANVDCPDAGNPCTGQICSLGKCTSTVLDGNLCDDGNGCTQASACQKGTCVGSDPLKDGDNCSDGTACTVGDSCKGGKCVAKAAAPDGTTCSDGGTPCSTPTVCAMGKCLAKNACDDANPCTIDSCSVVAGAKSCKSAAAPEGTFCDDGDICTASESCSAGACKGVQACTSQPIAMPCDGAGWTMSAKVGATGWAFDATPATPGFVSPPCSLNFNNGKDFAETLKSTGDAVSPPISLGKAALLTLQAYADTESGTSYDKKFIDISADGFATFSTFQWTPTSTDMKKWLPLKMNLASYAGKTVQLRFRFDSSDTYSNTGAGWFVDDLALALPPTQTSACATDAQCGDGNSCTADSCSSNGVCSNIAQDKALCDDGSVCTDSSACKGDTCVGGSPKACDDGDKCTLDSCDAVKGCMATAIPGCGEAKLPYASAFDCGGDLSAWVFQNSAAGPKWQVDGKPADPGFQSPSCSLNFNNDTDFACPAGEETLQGAVLSPIFDVSALPPGTPITVSFGLAGDWESNSFDNLDVVLLPASGTATAVTVSYDAPTGWTTKTIDATKFAGAKFRLKFSFEATDCAINNGAGAFIDDLKVSHSGCSKDADCNDGSPCTAETCSSGKCTATAVTGACDDGSACTSGDTCVGTTCTGTAKACDDQSDCTTDSCDKASGACKFATKAAGSFCTDGNPCSYADTCDSAGKCLGQVSADGSTCSDGNACTTKESCSAGVCKSLENVKDGSSCSDDTPCTTGDACSAGKCVGPTAACNDGNPCTDDSCAKLTTTTFKCDYPAGKDGVACDDGQPCTQDELCKAGACKGLDVCKYGLNEAFDACVIPVGWSADATSTNGTYWGTDAKPTPPGFYSAPCSLNFNDNTSYAGTGGIGKGAISSPEVDLSAAKAPTLTFRSYGGMASSLDKRTIEIVEGTTILQTVTMVYSSSSSDLNKWFAMSVDLKAHIGKKVKVRFRFESDSSSNNGAGWFIDDVKVQLNPAPAVVVVKTSGFAFSPDVLTINAGDSVEFQMPAMHAAMEVDQSSWEANDANPIGGGFLVGFGKTAKVNFSKPGTYYYVCPPHVSLGMKGKIVVQ